MADNKMRRVAEMFGKNLNETFYIKGFLSPFSFTELGLVSREQPFNCNLLYQLLTGELEIRDEEDFYD